MRLHDELKAGERYLESRMIQDAAADAWLLLEHVTGITRTVFLAEQARSMSAEQYRRYRELLEKRGSHIPLQYLTGEQEFMGLSFQVNPHVLIPRQDTEVLVEEGLKRLRPGMRVLDLCTGSGCIAISLARLSWDHAASGGFGSQEKSCVTGGDDESGRLTVEGSDISEEALAVAAVNADRLEADVKLIQSDLFSELSGKYDMIISNPPYIRTAIIEELSEEVRLHEPHQALDGKEDGLYFYRRIVQECGAYLVRGGWLLFETGYDQAAQVSTLLKAAGFTEIQTIRDLSRLDRVVLGRYGDPRER